MQPGGCDRHQRRTRWSVRGLGMPEQPSWSAGEPARSVLRGGGGRRGTPRHARPLCRPDERIFGGEWWSMPPANCDSTGASRWIPGGPVVHRGRFRVGPRAQRGGERAAFVAHLRNHRRPGLDRNCAGNTAGGHRAEATRLVPHTGRNGRWTMPRLFADGRRLRRCAPDGCRIPGAGGGIHRDRCGDREPGAGWNPDETYWFTDNVRHYDEPVVWE